MRSRSASFRSRLPSQVDILKSALYYPTVTKLKKIKIDFNERVDGQLPIEIVTDLGHVEHVKYLLQNGAIPNNDAFITALRKSYTSIAKLLLEYGVEINGDNLLYAVLYNNYEIVSILLKKEPRIVNYIDEQEETPLHIAIHHRLKVMTELLVDKGADLNNCIGFAVDTDNPDREIIQLLLDHKARIKLDDIFTVLIYKNQNNVLDILLETKRRPTDKEIIEFLIDNSSISSILYLLNSKKVTLPFHGKTLKFFIDYNGFIPSRQQFQKIYEEAFIEHEKKKLRNALRNIYAVTRIGKTEEVRYHMTRDFKTKMERHIKIFKNKLYANNSEGTRLSSRSLSEY